MNNKIFEKDFDFLKQHQQVIVLHEADKRVLICPAYQGRVMTSSAEGDNGSSFGWINYDLIASGKWLKHCNNFGGEDRYWIGPEGGQFSIFFKPGAAFTLDAWQTPPAIDTEPWELIKVSSTQAAFHKLMTLKNYAGNDMHVLANREVALLTDAEINNQLNLNMPEDIKAIGFKSVNKMTNAGDFEWNKTTGMLSIWILGQFVSADHNTVILPYQQQGTGEIVNDRYFGRIDEDRIRILEKTILFKADGKQRGKIGLGSERAFPLIGSFDRQNQVLTLVKYSFSKQNAEYVNSMWEHQQDPWNGDVVNSYNDGPLPDGSQMGPFYELETSSAAAALKPGEFMLHEHQTYHLTGSIVSLEKLVHATLGIKLEQCF